MLRFLSIIKKQHCILQLLHYTIQLSQELEEWHTYADQGYYDGYRYDTERDAAA